MPDTHTTSVDQQRLEKERIEDDGTVTLTRGGHAIHCLTVIGQVEGHTEAPQGQKTTKYEHVIPPAGRRAGGPPESRACWYC